MSYSVQQYPKGCPKLEQEDWTSGWEVIVVDLDVVVVVLVVVVLDVVIVVVVEAEGSGMKRQLLFIELFYEEW